MITQEILSSLPETFGIYQYLDRSGVLLYIGKAKNIKKRVNSYFRLKDQSYLPNPKNSPRIQLMVSQIHYIRTIVVKNEQDALILENSLIKQLKPKYNILLRDDKTYPYIYIDLNQNFPRFEITRQVFHKKNILYFGPYPSGCKELLNSIYDIFPLVQKPISCLKGKKTCLFYQIKKCKGPCEEKISQHDYNLLVKEALVFLKNKNKLLKVLENKMQENSDKLLFEQALYYKHLITKISPMLNFSQMDIPKPYNLDILCIAVLNPKTPTQKPKAILMKLFMREGKINSYDFEILQNNFDNKEEVFKQYILNFYKSLQPIPPEKILLSSQAADKTILESFLKTSQNQRILLCVPKKGFQKSLIETAIQNGLEILKQNTDKTSEEEKLLEELTSLLGLNHTPYRIEVFDTSHHGFEHNTGAMVTYQNLNFQTQSYRHYNLESQDEYAQMEELLKRRIESFSKNPPPDLWVIDGGSVQVKIARTLLESSGVDIDIIGISKEKRDAKAYRSKGLAKDILYFLEKNTIDPQMKDSKFLKNSMHTFQCVDSTYRSSENIASTQNHDNIHTPTKESQKFMHDRKISKITLSPKDPRLQFLQKLRDEAHRFALSFHRTKKAKSLTKNLPYTPAQTKKLLNYYCDFDTLAKADPLEIKRILKQRGLARSENSLQGDVTQENL